MHKRRASVDGRGILDVETNGDDCIEVMAPEWVFEGLPKMHQKGNTLAYLPDPQDCQCSMRAHGLCF